MDFQQGLSGLTASSKNLEVIGNNVANSATYGSKSSRAEFGDIYANALSGVGVSQIGLGVHLQTVAQQFTQGSITATDNPLDIAINGAGFFEVENEAGARMYTRNGQFKLNKDGYIVNNGGQHLLGYSTAADGTIIPKAAGRIQLPTQGIAPKATETVNMEMNLDARATPIPVATAFDPTNAKTYNNATSMTLYDVEGQAVPSTFYFKKIASADATATPATNDKWEVYMTANGSQIPATGPMTTVDFKNGKPLTAVVSSTFPIPQTTANGATTVPITGANGAGVVFDFSKATQWGTNFSVTGLSQSGHSSGSLADIKVEDNGIITARYTNGETQTAGQIEMANFRNPQGLQATGGNNWVETYASGQPVVGTPNTGTLGLLQSGSLEQSNIDLTGELVNMITAQRQYQANAQTIKTQDSIMQTLINLR